MTRRGSSGDDALTPEQFNHLVDVTKQSKDWLVNTFIVFMAGILGMRCGEIAHMTRDWIDFKSDIIKIPGYQPCRCGYCKTRAEDELERILIKKEKNKIENERNIKIKNKDISKYNINIPDISISDEEVMKKRWKPKTKQGIRSIPFFFNPEIKELLKEFFDTHEKLSLSPKIINDHISHLGKLAGLKNVYPHALRATAALKFAIDGTNAETLQVIMGWKDISMANTYVRMAGKQVTEALEKVYPHDRVNSIEYASHRVYFLNGLGKKLMRRKRRKDEKEWLLNLLLFKYSSKQKRLDET